MERRGLSGVISVVLIVLLALAGVVIVWAIVKPVLDGAGNKVETQSFSVSLGVKSNSVFINDTDDNLTLVVERGGGGGEIKGFNVVLQDENGNSFVYRSDGNLNSLETRRITVDYSSSDLEGVSKISVIPIFERNGAEVLGRADVYNVRGGDYLGGGAPPSLCTPSDTRNCGSDVGVCSFGTETCQPDRTWGACVGGIGPAMETCGDGLDQDCNGADLTCVSGGICGDGWVNSSEQCDGTNLTTSSCSNIGMGFEGGVLSCLPNCGFNVTSCFDNGNGFCEAGENHPADNSSCLDNSCYEPTCLNGCNQAAVANGGTDESCFGNTGCVGNNCRCDGAGVCTSQCSNGIQDGSETDVDCGGGTCSDCANGNSCLINGDCQSSNCVAGTCQAAPACDQGGLFFNGNCWYNATAGTTCNNYCISLGKSCATGAPNDNSSCAVCNNFYGGFSPTCSSFAGNYIPSYRQSLNTCYYRSSGIFSCSADGGPGYSRICPCV